MRRNPEDLKKIVLVGVIAVFLAGFGFLPGVAMTANAATWYPNNQGTQGQVRPAPIPRPAVAPRWTAPRLPNIQQSAPNFRLPTPNAASVRRSTSPQGASFQNRLPGSVNRFQTRQGGAVGPAQTRSIQRGNLATGGQNRISNRLSTVGGRQPVSTVQGGSGAPVARRGTQTSTRQPQATWTNTGVRYSSGESFARADPHGSPAKGVRPAQSNTQTLKRGNMVRPPLRREIMITEPVRTVSPPVRRGVEIVEVNPGQSGGRGSDIGSDAATPRTISVEERSQQFEKWCESNPAMCEQVKRKLEEKNRPQETPAQIQAKSLDARDNLRNVIDQLGVSEAWKNNAKQWVDEFYSKHDLAGSWKDPKKAPELITHMINRVGAQLERDKGVQEHKTATSVPGTLEEINKISGGEAWDNSNLPWGVKRQGKDVYDKLPPPVQDWLRSKAEDQVTPSNPLDDWIPGNPIPGEVQTYIKNKSKKVMEDSTKGLRGRTGRQQDALDGRGEFQ